MIDELTKSLIQTSRDIMEGKKLDPVGKADKDIDNDGDVDDSDEYLHKRREAIGKAMNEKGNAFTKALNAARENGDKDFVVAGKKYTCKEVEEYEDDMKKKEKLKEND
jgi:malonyl CoA-acyl carrier protein transacylase|tara:strand:+ start:602 stop:925 length:324 start_codon:yes stop_codon:yes gene_type:complete